LVNQLLQRLAKDDCIKELNLYGHGSFGLFALGNGQSHDLKRSTFMAYSGYHKDNDWQIVLKPLVGRFCGDAKLNLFGCWVGGREQGADLLFELAHYFNVTVRAPVDVYDANLEYKDRWQMADPLMKESPKAIKPRRPPTVRRTQSQSNTNSW
jgi:hypothetical protein